MPTHTQTAILFIICEVVCGTGLEFCGRHAAQFNCDAHKMARARRAMRFYGTTYRTRKNTKQEIDVTRLEFVLSV